MSGDNLAYQAFARNLASKYLNRKEEIKFFREYKRNSKILKEIEKINPNFELIGLANEKRKEYKRQLLKVRNIQDEIIRLYGAFVINKAKKIYYKKKNIGFGFMDLIQEGLRGLIKAADKFKVSKGYRFTTYANWWIIQSMFQFIYKNENAIRLPVNVGEARNKIFKNLDRLIDEHGPKLTYNKIDKELNLRKGMTKRIFKLNRVVKSLDDKIYDQHNKKERMHESSRHFGDVIPDKESLETKILNKVGIIELTRKLKKEEKITIIFFYGLNRKIGKKTLKEIGETLRPEKPLSREAVRQIKEKGLNKLRTSRIGKELVA